MLFTSEFQTAITVLFVNEKVVNFLVRTYRIFCYQNYSGLLKVFVFAFSAPSSLVGVALHVAYVNLRSDIRL